jgi:hypothetical protein
MKAHIKIADLPNEMPQSQVLKHLDICYPTLCRWMETGRISKGRKVFHHRVFTKAEVVKALKTPAKPTVAFTS